MGAESLLARMKNSKAGWKVKDLERLYKSYGFECIEGSKHTLFVHPDFPDLRGTVTRSSSVLPVGYITHAIRLIENLKARRGARDENA